MSVAVPLPEFAAGNWPLSEDPDEIIATAKDAGNAPTDAVVVVCAGTAVGAGAGDEPPPPPHAEASAKNANALKIGRALKSIPPASFDRGRPTPGEDQPNTL